MGISRNEALACFRSDDLIGIGMEADAIRRSLHPEGVVTYSLDASLSYASLPRTHPFETLYKQIEDTPDLGGDLGRTALLLHGEVLPGHTVPWFEDLLRTLKERLPAVGLHGLSATEILAIAAQSGLSLHDTLARLHASGLDSISGNDAAILDDDVQQSTRISCKASDWIAVHRTAHALGIRSAATMLFGSGETFEHRLNHLEALRQLQSETGGFTSFTPRALQPESSAVPGFEEATAVEYLKTLAISRMVLDNIENIQADLETQGLKVLQVALRFGSNDTGSVTLAHVANAATEEQLRQVIRDAGFRPVQRDTLYRTLFLN